MPVTVQIVPCPMPVGTRFQDLTGKIFSRLTVLALAGQSLTPNNAKPRCYYWHCQCKCGNTTLVSGSALRQNHIRSCGCMHKEWLQDYNYKHGHTSAKGGSPTYHTWANMWQRCTNPKNSHYHHYGARGIAICDRWKDFRNFLADMGEKPERLMLERKDNNKGYSPTNCTWGNIKEQNQNKRNNHLFTIEGVTACLAEHSRRYNINFVTALTRINRHGWSPERAFLTPVKQGRKKEAI